LQHLLEHLFVQGEIGDHLLEAAIFVLELPHASQLDDPHACVALLPGVEDRLADAELAADLRGRRALLGLAQRVGDCSSVKRAFFMALLPGSRGPQVGVAH
jgi:hypothetical protein